MSYAVDRRPELLKLWATTIDQAARMGAFGGSSAPRGGSNPPIEISSINAIAGPRAGALELDAGFATGNLLRVLSANDMATTRQMIPWPFIGQPAVYMNGRYVRVEAGWDDSLSVRQIRVRDLNTRPIKSGHWLSGVNEYGRPVIMHLSDQAPHFLVAGSTGSGKSVCVRSIVTQLSQRGDKQILIDGKFEDGLRYLDHLPGMVGPIASTIEAARSALAWAVAEMQARYERGETNAARLCITFDEFQEFFKDDAIVEMVRRIAAQGRAANVSLILTTQHPDSKSLGDDATIKRNIPGRIALRVSDVKASETVIGQSYPRADWLLGAGDAYVLVPGTLHRVQIAFYDQSEVDRLLTSRPALAAWPEFDPATLGSAGSKATSFEAKEIATSLICATEGVGRPTLLRRLGMKDGDRARRLIKLGNEIVNELDTAGAELIIKEGDEDAEA